MPIEDEVTRKLRAILSADVKGYSLLMADDEAFTVKTLKSYRKVMSAQIVRHKGRVVDTPGDNLLSEFASVVDAVQCAVEVQKILIEKNRDLPPDKRLEFRMGVNIGDIIQDGDSIYGAGVNVAARIEGMADAGGICISRNAYDHVKDKLNYGYEYLGEHEVKNIKDPVRVYKVLTNQEDAGKLIGENPQQYRKKWPWLAVATVAFLIGIIVWQFYYEKLPPIEAASIDNMAFPLPDKPSIAVLPFKNISSDSKQDFLADGITDSITGTISRVPGLFVISKDAAFAYKGKTQQIKTASEQLGVQNILSGTVQKDGNRLRINVQLIDALTGRHLWAEKFDKNMGDIFSIQDKISKEILTALQVKLVESEQARVWARGTDNLDAYLKFLQAYEIFRSFSKENMVLTRKGMQEAIELDPNYDAPYSVIGSAYLIDFWYNWGESRLISVEKAVVALQKAIALAPFSDLPYACMGHLFVVQRRFDEAVEVGEKAIAFNPNGDLNMVLLAITFNYVRRYEEAITLFKEAQRRNPDCPAWYIHNLGSSYRGLGKWDDAIEQYQRALDRDPDHFPAMANLACVYGMAGRLDEGRSVAAKILKIIPNYSESIENHGFKYKSDNDLILDGCRKVGIPVK